MIEYQPTFYEFFAGGGMDMVCGTIGRPCPKLADPVDPAQETVLGPYRVPPPCIYMFPATVPAARNNPHPPPQPLARVELLDAFHRCFGGRDKDVNAVDFQVSYRGADTVRQTTIRRDGIIQRQSDLTAIRRS